MLWFITPTSLVQLMELHLAYGMKIVRRMRKDKQMRVPTATLFSTVQMIAMMAKMPP